MGRPKNEETEFTRDKLEGFLWAATGWRGDPDVIDGILAKVDVYVQTRIRVAGLEKRAMVAAAERAAQRAAAAAPKPKPEPEHRLSQEVLTALVDASLFTGDAMGKVSSAVSAIERAAAAVRGHQDAPAAAEPVWAMLPGLEEVRIHPQDAQKLADWYEALILRPVGRAVDLEEAQAAAEEYVAEYESEHGPIPEEAYAEADRVLNGIVPDEVEIEHAPDVDPDDLETDAEADALVAAVLNDATGADPANEHAEPESKRCNRCDQIKPFEEFHRDKASPDGYKYTCKKCDSKRAAARAERDKVMAAQTAADATIAAQGETQ